MTTIIGTGPCYPPLQCCFCGAVHKEGDPRGYAGEIPCHICGKGGQGEADDLNSFYKRVASEDIP